MASSSLLTTILIPGIVDIGEVEKIAKFLSSINPEIRYRIYEFDPKHARQPIARKPSPEEMVKAFEVAKKYLVHVESISASEVYDSNYEYVEIREDSLQDIFKKN
jgi:pyruvate-formate lyase-activating enzyme